MTAEEYAMWTRAMQAARGRWVEDLVMSHNNPRSRRLYFRPSEMVVAARDGMFIEIDCADTRGRVPATVTAGYYHGAVPHIGEATFFPIWGVCMLDGFGAAVGMVRHHISKPINHNPHRPNMLQQELWT